jgi:recombinase
VRGRTRGTWRQIADRLNAEGDTTRRGAKWNPVQVARVLERDEAGAVYLASGTSR